MKSVVQIHGNAYTLVCQEHCHFLCEFGEYPWSNVQPVWKYCKLHCHGPCLKGQEFLEVEVHRHILLGILQIQLH